MGRRPKDYNPLTDGGVGEIQSDEASVKYSKAVRDFLLKVIDMADEEAGITPVDRERFEGFLQYGSAKELAKKTKLSTFTINSSLGHVVKVLEGMIAHWEAPHRRLAELQREIAELKKPLQVRSMVEHRQLQAVKELKEENERLKATINELKGKGPEMPKKTGAWRRCSVEMQTKLSRSVGKIALPALTVSSLESNGILNVYNLVRYTESQLSHVPGLSGPEVIRIIVRMRQMGLRLGMEVEWDEVNDTYLIKT